MHGLVGIALGLVVATGVLVVSVEASGASSKHPFNPWAGMSDQQRQVVVDQTHAQNVKYLQDFEAKHGDPRSLPVIKISTWQGPPTSVGAAAAQAALIVHGVVQAVHFSADPSGNAPQMTATVSVKEVGKGSVASSTIVVRQIGGPVAQPGGRGAMVRLEDEELILPGDEIVMFLTRSQTTAPEYRAVYGSGIYFVRNGNISGESARRYGLDGQGFGAVWKTVTNPQLGTGAFPLQTGAGG